MTRRRRPEDQNRPHTFWDARELAQLNEEMKALREFTPNNTEAEAALLGALMIDNRRIEDVITLVTPEHFFDETHARIFERITVLHAAQKKVTPITLRPYFDGEVIPIPSDDQRSVIEMPLVSYLAKLTGSGAGLIGAREFAIQIRDLALLREIVVGVGDISEAARNTKDAINPRATLEMAEMRLNQIGEMIPEAKATGSKWSAGFDGAVKAAEEVAEGKPTAGVKIVGYDDWNEVAGAMGPGDYIALGGRPSMGKTAVACAVAAGSAMAMHGTDFLSLEMSADLIHRRLLAHMIYEQNVTSGYEQLQKGVFTRADREAMARAREAIVDKPLWVDDPDEMFVEQLYPYLMKRKRMWERQGIVQRLCIMDYLERFQTQRHFHNPVDRVGYISDQVKRALKKAKVAGILLCQLSRAVESREDKRPMLSDLRQSGSIEQDCDTAIFVYRDEYYLRASKPIDVTSAKYQAWDDDYRASRDRIELSSKKRREGALATRTGYFFTNEQAIRSSDFYASDLFGAASDRGSFGGEFGFSEG